MIHYMTANGIGNAWVANELHQVEAAGIPFRLHTLRKDEQGYHLSEWANRIYEQTRSVYPIGAVGLALSALAAPFLFRGRFFAALCNAIFGRRESFMLRLKAFAHFWVACHWARVNRHDSVTHIHSQWIHSSGTVAMYGAWLLGASFSFTGHAADLFRERVALKDKIRRAEFIACISTFHRDFYIREGADPAKLHIVYCGIDPEVFTPRPLSDWSDRPYRIRSSGRLVDKKGFGDLIEACRILADRGVPFECVIGGSGPLRDTLVEQVDRLKLHDHVTVTGEQLKQEKIPEFMYGGDVYILACVWAADNDVDGLPQMLMEAAACGLPLISTRLVGIPDLIIEGETGLLVEPNHPEQLADAIERMRDDPGLARRVAEQSLRRVHEHFNLRNCLEPLLNLYRRKLGMPMTSSQTEAAPRPLASASVSASASER